MGVVVVIPTYNESGNLARLAEALLALPVPGLSLLVVDDGSPDGTGRLADALAAAAPGRMAVLHRQGERGLGLAYRDGFRKALESRPDAVVQMDADFSHAPADVPRLLDKLVDCDVAVGSRYVSGGRIDQRWGFGRVALSRVANTYARTFLGLGTHDATAGFKAWRRSALEGVLRERIRSNGYLFLVEMTYVCERLGFAVGEVPIYFVERTDGRTKMSLRVKLQAAIGVLDVWRRYHRLRPPA